MRTQNQNRPRVYVVVLNWNNYAATRSCLNSLREVTYPNLQILVVDNGSADGSGKQLAAEFPDFEFIFNDRNEGFSRGCNVGIRAALKDPACAYVLLLNNDAVVTPGFLEQAVETAEANPQIGLVGGKLLFSSESKTIWYAGGEIDRWRGASLVRGFREEDQGQYDVAGEVGFIIGALMLIKRVVLEKVGLLPEEYFFATEDIDYSLAVRQAGFTLHYVPEFLAYHGVAGSHTKYDPKFVYNNYRSKLLFQEKYLPKSAFFFWKLVFQLYGKIIACRRWQKIRNEDPDLNDKRAPFDELKFAFAKAMADHGKDVLSEETLKAFNEALKCWKRQRVSQHPI